MKNAQHTIDIFFTPRSQVQEAKYPDKLFYLISEFL